MASSVTTRQGDEKQRTIVMVGEVSHQILGAKLPSNRQVLQTFFYNMRFVKLDRHESARLAIDAVLIFWQQARIPTRSPYKCSDKLIKMYDIWGTLKKTSVEKMKMKTKEQYDKFIDELDDLFDIAHNDALTMMRIEEDKNFLKQQRMKGRPGSMLGIDQNLAEKEARSELRKKQEEARKLRHAEASKEQQSGKFFSTCVIHIFTVDCINLMIFFS